MKKYLLGLAAVGALALGTAATAQADPGHRHGGHRGHNNVRISSGYYYAPAPAAYGSWYAPPRRYYHRPYYRPYYVERPVAYYPAPYYGPALGLSFNFR